MSQASSTKVATPVIITRLTHNLREAGFIALGIMTVCVFVALFSYHPEDPGWSRVLDGGTVHNAAGSFGAWLADVLLYAFGYLAYLLPFVMLHSSWKMYGLCHRRQAFDFLSFSVRFSGLLMLFLGGTALGWMHFVTGDSLPHALRGAGGVLGDSLGGALLAGLGVIGGTLIGLAIFFIGVTLYTGLSWLRLADFIGHWLFRLGDRIWVFCLWLHAHYARRKPAWGDQLAGHKARKERSQTIAQHIELSDTREPPHIEPVAPPPVPGGRLEREKQQELFHQPPSGRRPSLALLDEPEAAGNHYTNEDLEAISRRVELKLKDFGISATVTEVCPGPVITRFELELAPGIKVGQVSTLAKDLARSLSVVSVRIVDIIPGKTVIGLEIPNQQRDMVWLREILNSAEYEKMKSPLALGLGKDIGGRPVVTDLAKMPHLLVAGTTGSGKSVALNAMILSLLYKSSAEETRLILIDPKMLELSIYEGIPHLLTSVVTDMKEAANALRWAVSEMERRYRLLAGQGVRNIHSYNRKLKEAADSGEALTDPEDPTGETVLARLPFVVIVVDELADMMMTVGKKVEELIARLAQKARASGIHLILATQRPSVDVITGLIKANIPCRIAFQVSSKVDSRTILDQMGAESLLGHGDMLFLSSGTNIPERIHGVFVSDEEVHRVVDDIRIETPEYNADILNGSVPGGKGETTASASEGEQDELYDAAVSIVTETRKTSISYVQRRLKIGYNRAARLMEEMESAGVVSPLGENGIREVLVAAAPPSLSESDTVDETQ